jgi:hypothetical protein
MSNIEFFGSNNFMVIIPFTQWLIPNPTVCSNASARLNMRTYETNKTLRGGIRNTHKPDPTDPFATLVFVIGFVFHGDYNKTLVFSTAATLAGPFAAYICFIHLHLSIQIIAIWSNHGSPQPVKPVPGRMITSKSKYSLEAQGIGAIFLACNMPHSLKPQSQRFSAVVEDGTGRDGSLMSTFLALKKPSFGLPCLIMFTFWTAKTIGPAQGHQVLNAGGLRNESVLEFHERPGVIFHSPKLQP